MMRNTAYRLAEYKVIENELGDLWWESHMGLGSLKIGKCFINGDILFIKPSDSTGPGFLKGEFLDHLNKLPKWEKTDFFCSSYTLYYTRTGAICRRLEEDKEDDTRKVAVRNQTRGGGINIMPIIMNKGDIKERLNAFFDFCKLLAMMTLKLLFGCVQIVSKVSRVFIDQWNRFKG
jgi:hypothetical protein